MLIGIIFLLVDNPFFNFKRQDSQLIGGLMKTKKIVKQKLN